MTKQELRNNLIDFFTQKEIDYDGSQNTMTLYRWAVRHNGFEKIPEFEPKPKESHSDQIIDQMNKDNEKEPEKPKEKEPEKPKEKEPEKPKEKEPEKPKEKEPEKDEPNLWLWIGIAAAAIAIILIINHYANGKVEKNAGND